MRLLNLIAENSYTSPPPYEKLIDDLTIATPNPLTKPITIVRSKPFRANNG
jgi:hypothetical protein